MSDAATAISIPTTDVCRGRWIALETQGSLDRFAEIMQINDDRYQGLHLGLDSWIQSKNNGGQPAEFFGWIPDGSSSDDVLEVLAFTSRRSPDGKRVEPRLRMLGMAADRIPPSDCCDVQIQLWLARALVLLYELFGCGFPIEAMRPKTMTFKPMQRFHDFASRGTVFQVIENGVPVLRRVDVIGEEDRGHVVHWNLQFSEVAAI
ncbi:MAG: hypothetical protein AB7O26_05160 [Planctomycetaceae bacterium]